MPALTIQQVAALVKVDAELREKLADVEVGTKMKFKLFRYEEQRSFECTGFVQLNDDGARVIKPARPPAAGGSDDLVHLPDGDTILIQAMEVASAPPPPSEAFEREAISDQCDPAFEHIFACLEALGANLCQARERRSGDPVVVADFDDTNDGQQPGAQGVPPQLTGIDGGPAGEVQPTLEVGSLNHPETRGQNLQNPAPPVTRLPYLNMNRLATRRSVDTHSHRTPGADPSHVPSFTATASSDPADALVMVAADQCAAATRLLALMPATNLSDVQRTALGSLRQQTASMMEAAASVLRSAAQHSQHLPTPPSHAASGEKLRGQPTSATTTISHQFTGPVPRPSQAASPATAIRRCKAGATVCGPACQVTSELYHVSTDPMIRESAKALVDGSDYCQFHLDEKRYLDTFAYGDEDEDDDGGDGGEASYRILNDAHAASSHVFRGVGEYGLVAATSNKVPRVPPSTTLPSWVASGNWRAEQDFECRCIKAFNALVVHKPSDSVVGYVSGQLVHRWVGVVNDCDDYSAEMLSLVEDLFDVSGGPADDGCGPVSNELRFKDRLKRAGKCKWGTELDDGRFAHLNRIELEAEHRGKGALAVLAEPFRLFCVDNEVESVFVQLGFITRPAIIGDGRTALSPQRNAGNSAKLRDSYATMGFRRVADTEWMAMVPDRSHPCWDPNTHEKATVPIP